MQQPPALEDRDVIEARALRRRQVMAAFLHGTTPPEAWDGAARRGIALGVALTVLAAVVVGIVGLAGAARLARPRP